MMPRGDPTRFSVTRRGFLTGTAAGILTGCMGVEARWDAPLRPVEAGTRWALLSDVHIGASERTWWNGENPAENLRRVVAQAATMRPRHVLVAGDVAFQVGRGEDYATFQRLIQPLRSEGASVTLMPGNHDDRGRLREAAGREAASPVAGKWVSVRDVEGTRWIHLDSLALTGEIGGDLGGAQLDWLARTLDGAAQTPTIVVVHHNPEDAVFGVRDGAAFHAVVLPRRQVKAVVFGHTHAYRLWTQEGLHFVNLPATSYLFHLLPRLGWVLADVYDDGMRVEFRPTRGKPEALFLKWRSMA